MIRSKEHLLDHPLSSGPFCVSERLAPQVELPSPAAVRCMATRSYSSHEMGIIILTRNGGGETLQSAVEVLGIRGSRSCRKQRGGGGVGDVPCPVGFACSRTGFDCWPCHFLAVWCCCMSHFTSLSPGFL